MLLVLLHVNAVTQTHVAGQLQLLVLLVSVLVVVMSVQYVINNFHQAVLQVKALPKQVAHQAQLQQTLIHGAKLQ